MRDGVHLFDPTNPHHKVLAQHGAASIAAGNHLPSHICLYAQLCKALRAAEAMECLLLSAKPTLLHLAYVKLVSIGHPSFACFQSLTSRTLPVYSGTSVVHSSYGTCLCVQERPWWMWCLCMASGAAHLPPGGVKAYKTWSQGTSPGIWTTHTVGLPLGCPKMCLKPACCPWNMRHPPQDGRSA